MSSSTELWHEAQERTLNLMKHSKKFADYVHAHGYALFDDKDFPSVFGNVMNLCESTGNFYPSMCNNLTMTIETPASMGYEDIVVPVHVHSFDTDEISDKVVVRFLIDKNIHQDFEEWTCMDVYFEDTKICDTDDFCVTIKEIPEPPTVVARFNNSAFMCLKLSFEKFVMLEKTMMEKQKKADIEEGVEKAIQVYENLKELKKRAEENKVMLT